MCAHIPGLKVVFPATPYDAKGLMYSALTGSDPVIFFESQRIYDQTEEFVKDGVPTGYYEVPIGEPDVKKAGKDLTILSIGATLYRAMEAAKELESKHGLSCEIIDARSIVPFNYEKVLENVRLIMAKKRDCGSKMDVRMNAVIMRTNYHQIEEFLELAKREGFNQVSLMALHFDLAPEENIFYGSRDSAPARAVAEAIPRLREKARQYGIDLDILLPPGADECGSAPAAVAETDEKSPQPQPAAPAAVRNICCKMPWRYLMMCDKGDVYLTGSCVKSIGNVYQNSLDEIWNSETARQYRENMIENKFEGFCRSECESRWE
jgi:MoaA/NifB/PqqE/SkfB family radical SAM enzyme